ncbi:uncharacterized protein DUF4389 [Pseudomonas duriflava]|uniref:Uncharacterized protein DUF4389 n=1 Tax=Pseudomonas duriflava TaxID=459528 RepID=A0A562Q9U2_9PSED|nr:DUF4389 domain-containing protein [Pseudomonas duriflava]TWI53527.1 uncharacterized protein DUF4389 [Pseudomonas duriflava]
MSSHNYERETISLRLVWMVLFVFVWLIAQYLLAGLVIAQLINRLVKGHTHEGMARLGTGLSEYLAQIVRFGTFASEEKPWPVADWPGKRAAQKHEDAI